MAIAKTSMALLLVLAVAIVALLAFSAVPAAAAAPEVVGGGGETPFICVAVGAGVLNHRPDAGALPNDNYTFLPGHNQAGAHVNANGVNPEGPGVSPGPGNGNSDWSPIWPAPVM